MSHDPASMMSAMAESASEVEKEVPGIVSKLQEVSSFIDRSILKVDLEAEQTIIATMGDFMPTPDTIERYESELSNNVTAEERVRFARRFFEWVPIRPAVLQRYKKNAVVARKLREKGNELYKRKELEDALENYNRAVLFAPEDDQELGMAYANRSAVLFELGNPEAAILDIDLSLAHNYPATMSHKLEQRRVKCQESMQKDKEIEVDPPEELRQIKEEKEQMQRIREQMIRIKKPNPMIPVASACVEMRHSKEMGRYLVVNEDVPAGTVLAVEDPYVSVLYGGAVWDVTHCHECLKRIRRGIPCHNCVFALYCDEACRQKSERIHQFECKCMGYLHVNTTPVQAHLAFRAICKVGPAELFRIFSTQDPSYFGRNAPFGTDPSTKYESDSYLSVYHLTTNSNKMKLQTQCVNTHNSLLATEVLEKQTEFFQGIPQDQQLNFKDFIAALMIRHIEAVSVNSVGIGEVKGLDNVSLEDFYQRFSPQGRSLLIEFLSLDNFASAIYPVFSLMNHSCDPNVTRINDATNGTAITISYRALKKGEPLLVCYISSSFTYSPKLARQAELMELYHFKCNCTACHHDWPVFEDANQSNFTFCCPRCATKFPDVQRGASNEEFQKCVLKDSDYQCKLCGKSFSAADLAHGLEVFSGKASDAQQLLWKNKLRESLAKFRGCLEYYQYHLTPPYAQRYVIEGHLREAMALIFHFSSH